MGDKQWRWASGVQMPVRKSVLGEDGVTTYICPKIGEGGCQVTAFILYTSPP